MLTYFCNPPIKICVAILFCCCCSISAALLAQCNGVVGNFPYVENFEANDGGWVSGGTASDWAWGTPNKPVINTAGSGSKCWIIGGTNGTTYNVNERSYLLTPCFDFTNIENPLAVFKIFWETESGYDGSNFQYTINDGLTWVNVGSTGQQNECFVQNWYNNANISNLTTLATPKAGWSGNIQTIGDPSCGLGSGSGDWRTASYCLNDLAGQPEVRFRFTFGAGSICNEYDGFAVDSFSIASAPPLFEAFSVNISNCDNEVIFGVLPLTSDACFGTLDWNWSFGDGAASTAVSFTNHVYDAPGSYQVQLTATGNCFNQTIQQPVEIITPPVLDVVSTISLCGQNNGTATVLSAGSSPVGYLWSTNPPQTGATAINLAPGNYSVTVTLSNNCTVVASATVLSDMPIPDIEVPDILAITCSIPEVALDGSSSTPDVNFNWGGPNGFNSNMPSPIVTQAGTYILTVTDSGTGCSATATTTVLANNIPPIVDAGSDIFLTCFDPVGILQATTTTTDATYSWTGPSGFSVSSPQTTTQITGQYILVVTDNISGCSSQDDLMVTSADLTPDTTTIILQSCIDAQIGTQILELTNQYGCDSLIIIQTVYNDTIIATYLTDTICQTTCIDFNGNCLEAAGIYTDTLISIAGCDSIIYLLLTVVHCPWLDQALYIPNIFSPNYDGINDKFKAEGINFETYEMRIFDRWGNHIFQSNAVDEGWDGTFRGKPADIGIYAYYVVIRFINGNTVYKEGDVLLVR